jgi:sugar phosphate isomerase/epimerase
VFRALGEIGYRNVELAGRYGWNGRQIANQLRNAGLRAVSSHDDPRGSGWMQALEDAAAAGQEYIGMAYQQDPFTEASYKALAQQFNTAGEQAAEYGLQFFYHNHDFEFTNKRADGAPLYDILLEDTDPDLVKFQLDLYWAIEGGVSPLEYLSSDPERFPLYHVKDRTWADRPDAEDWEDVGPGAIDWPDIFASGAQRGLKKYYVVEHDDPRLSHPDDDEAGLITAQVGFDYLINVRF